MLETGTGVYTHPGRDGRLRERRRSAIVAASMATRADIHHRSGNGRFLVVDAIIDTDRYPL